MSSELKITQVKHQHNADLARMIRSTFHEHNAPTKGTVFEDPTTDDLYDLFQKEGSVLWVLESNKKAIGCCGIFPTSGLSKDTCELVKFYIAPEARGKGYGRQLMTKSCDWALNYGYEKIYLESLDAFNNAVDLYKKSGFVLLVRPMGDSGHNGCNLWMLKVL